MVFAAIEILCFCFVLCSSIALICAISCVDEYFWLVVIFHYHILFALMFCLDIMFVIRVVCQISVVNCIGKLYIHAAFVLFVFLKKNLLIYVEQWLFAFILLSR